MIFFSLFARSVSEGHAQDGYFPFVRLPSSFSDTMNGKVSPTGVIFASIIDVESYIACDSYYIAEFPIQFASLAATGWVMSSNLEYLDFNGMPANYYYKMIHLDQMMFNFRGAIAAAKTIKVLNATKLISNNPVFTFNTDSVGEGPTNKYFTNTRAFPKFDTTTSADFQFSLAAGDHLLSIYIGSIAGNRDIKIGTSPGTSDVLSNCSLIGGAYNDFTITRTFPTATTLYVTDGTASTQSINLKARILK